MGAASRATSSVSLQMHQQSTVKAGVTSMLSHTYDSAFSRATRSMRLRHEHLAIDDISPVLQQIVLSLQIREMIAKRKSKNELGRWFKTHSYETPAFQLLHHPFDYQAMWPWPIRTAPEKCSFLRICDLYTLCSMCSLIPRNGSLRHPVNMSFRPCPSPYPE